jgi:hypothetical protein
MKELKDIPKVNPFKVPESYFGELEGRILASTTGSERAPGKKRLVRKLLPYVAVAASVALLAIIGYTSLYRDHNENGRNLIPEITVNEFMETYLNEIDIITLEDKVSESGVLIGRTGISKGDIIDYLVNENIDVLDIYENL